MAQTKNTSKDSDRRKSHRHDHSQDPTVLMQCVVDKIMTILKTKSHGDTLLNKHQ